MFPLEVLVHSAWLLRSVCERVLFNVLSIFWIRWENLMLICLSPNFIFGKPAVRETVQFTSSDVLTNVNEWRMAVADRLTNSYGFSSCISDSYQEILTDPSYSGQFVLMTQPHIGNTGVNLGTNFATFLKSVILVFRFCLLEWPDCGISIVVAFAGLARLSYLLEIFGINYSQIQSFVTLRFEINSAHLIRICWIWYPFVLQVMRSLGSASQVPWSYEDLVTCAYTLFFLPAYPPFILK